MGMFDFIKTIFSSPSKIEEPKTEVPKEEIISISNLESWFVAKEAEIIKSAELVIKENSPKVNASIKNCEAALVALRAAGPRYLPLYEKAKNVADGNRQIFIVSTENFLRSVKLPNSPSLLHDFVADFEVNLSNFMMDSNRSFIISNEFFTDQAINVKSNLQELDKLMQEVKCFCQKNKFAELKKAKEDITKLAKKIQQNQQLKDELVEVDSNFMELHKQKERLEQDQANFLQSAEFLEKQSTEKESKDVQAQVKTKDNEIYAAFSNLDTPLRKLAWENPDLKKKVNKYLNNLIESVSEDENFNFREILIKLRCAIEAGDIDLRDKKRVQAIRDINNLTETFVRDWLGSYRSVKAKETELRQKLENSVAAKKEVELKTELEKIGPEMENLKRQKTTLVGKQNRINLDEELNAISEKLSALLGYTVKISV
jgi:DNA polymerase III delta prime subunit